MDANRIEMIASKKCFKGAKVQVTKWSKLLPFNDIQKKQCLKHA